MFLAVQTEQVIVIQKNVVYEVVSCGLQLLQLTTGRVYINNYSISSGKHQALSTRYLTPRRSYINPMHVEIKNNFL